MDKGKILSDNTVREYLYKRVNGFSEDGYTIGNLSIYYLYHIDNRWVKNPPIERLINIPLEKVDRILVYDNRQAHKHINIINETSIPFEDRKTISIHSRSIFDKIEDTPGIRQTQIEGYSTIADYYHPQHTKEIIQGDVDYRRTLYWNPTVELDKNGEAIIQFYNNSECKLPIVNCETLYY